MDILCWLQEALVILIEIAEHPEQLQVFILRHLNLCSTERTQLHKLRLSSSCLNGELLADDIFEKRGEGGDVNFEILVGVCKTQNQVDFTGSQCEFLRVTDDFPDIINMHATTLIDLVAIITSEEVVSEFLDVDIHNAATSQIETDIIQIRPKVDIINLIVAILHHIVSQKQVDLLDVEVGCIVEHLAHLIEVDFTGVLFSVWISVKGLESALEDSCNLLDLSLEHKHQCFFIDFFDGSCLLLEIFVTSQERLDCLDTYWNEIGPCDIANLILVSKGKQNADIVFLQIVSGQALESFKELRIGQLAIMRCISLREKQSQCSLKCFDEPG